MDGSLRVVITGATSGLGREMARQLALSGARVAITGRRAAKLDEVAKLVEQSGGVALPLVGSVADAADVKAHYAVIRAAWGGLDWAVLNAGVGDSNNARTFSAEHYHWTFATNVGGVVNWLAAVIPDMVAAGRGTIAGVASIAGWRGLPQSGAYSASKAAVITLLESARVDLRGTGVKVVTICPGFVRSEMTARNDAKDMIFLLDTDDGVRRMIRGIRAGRRIVHFPWPLSLFMKYVVHNMPGALYDAVVSRLVSRRKRPYVDESRPPPADHGAPGRPGAPGEGGASASA
ncbi:MAG: SDR family NAD(P)-dependent oxidoreductase [Planctomycetes bacterium]|nr:SDR family NAD(P)-dependent oxidoreductase [Planctomycetota bacterium]